VRTRNGTEGETWTEQTTEQQLLTEPKKQTKALENLNVLAQVWSVLAAIGSCAADRALHVGAG
jgi:hypothetical protein